MFKIIQMKNKIYGSEIIHKLVNSLLKQAKIKAFIIILIRNPKQVKHKAFIITLIGNKLPQDNKG